MTNTVELGYQTYTPDERSRNKDPKPCTKKANETKKLSPFVPSNIEETY